jgi:uncharacterized protein YfaS (alpha-2-macroglobulin family)
VLKAGENEIVLQSESQARLSYVLDGQMLIAQAEIAAAGIPIQRYYLDPKNKSPLAEIKAGDLVLVRLVFNTKTEISYSILEDHLPGGLQALNERLNTSGHDLLAEAEEWYYYEDRYYYEQYGYNNKEIRAGQVTFFITTLYPGQHVFEYLARAVTPGEFIALPAEFSAMYAADQWGRSASARVVIRER